MSEPDSEVMELRRLLLETTFQRDVAWQELRSIRDVLRANPEESTLDQIIALQAKFKKLMHDVVRIAGPHLNDWIGLLECHEKYNELLMAVAQKFADETRHATALRYIRDREMLVRPPVKGQQWQD